MIIPIIILTFLVNTILFPVLGFSQESLPTVLDLPRPGAMISTSSQYTPALVKGLTINRNNPFDFDFIVDTGEAHVSDAEFKREYIKLIKYFLASLTTPEEDMWVNLSPYEKNRIVPSGFGSTEMGRDLLAEDYFLKQLTASLIYPEKQIGKEFWQKVYTKAQKLYGTTNVPINTFNKVWIVPEKAIIYEHSTGAFIVSSHLKVMLEEDYLSLRKHLGNSNLEINHMNQGKTTEISKLSSQVVKEVLIPAIEEEVNKGKNFATLRQIYNSMILATWYKKNLRQSLLGQIYLDKNRTKGISVQDKDIDNKIYRQYLEAYKKGAFNFIREEPDGSTQAIIPRKYFSGGIRLKADLAMTNSIGNAAKPMGEFRNVHWQAEEIGTSINGDKAMSTAVAQLKAARMMAGLHTVTGNSGFKSTFEKNGPAGIAKIALELQENGIPSVFDNIEALKLFKQARHDALAGYFVNNDIKAALQGVAAGAGMLIATDYLSSDVIVALRERAPSVLVVNMVSSKDDVLKLVDESVQAGAQGIQFKPFKDFVIEDDFTVAGDLLKVIRAKHPGLFMIGAGAIFGKRAGNVLRMPEDIIPAVALQGPESVMEQARDYRKQANQIPPVHFVIREEYLYRPFGKTGLKFFIAGHGAIWTGRKWPTNNPNYVKPERDEVFASYDTAFQEMANQEGMVMIDTAPAYGEKGVADLNSEEWIGEYFKEHPQLRQRAFISTKVGEESPAPPEVKGEINHTVEHLQYSVDRSLQRLGHIDLLYIHQANAQVLADETYKSAILRMKQEQYGGIKFLGASISSKDVLEEAVNRNLIDWLDVIQIPGWLFNERKDLVQKIYEKGIAIVVNSAGRGVKDNDYRTGYLNIANDPRVSVILIGSRVHLKETVGYFTSQAEEIEYMKHPGWGMLDHAMLSNSIHVYNEKVIASAQAVIMRFLEGEESESTSSQRMSIIGLFGDHQFPGGFKKIVPMLKQIVEYGRRKQRPIVFLLENARIPAWQHLRMIPAFYQAAYKQGILAAGPERTHIIQAIYEDEGEYFKSTIAVDGAPHGSWGYEVKEFLKTCPHVNVINEDIPFDVWLKLRQYELSTINDEHIEVSGGETAALNGLKRSVLLYRDAQKARDQYVSQDQLLVVANRYAKDGRSPVVVILRGSEHNRMLDGIDLKIMHAVSITLEESFAFPQTNSPINWLAYHMADRNNFLPMEETLLKLQDKYDGLRAILSRDVKIKTLADFVQKAFTLISHSIGSEFLSQLQSTHPYQRDPVKVIDRAQIVKEINNVGGIDLNPNMLNLQVQKSDQGFQYENLPISDGNDIQIEGIVPIIIKVTSINNVLPLLGFSQKN